METVGGVVVPEFSGVRREASQPTINSFAGRTTAERKEPKTGDI